MRDVHVATALAVLAGCASAGVDGDGSVPDSAGGHDAAPDGTPDDAAPIDAAIPDAVTLSERTFTDDTAVDFAASATSEATVEAWGAIAPVAYYTGGLLQRGSDSGTFTDPSATTWATVQGYPATGKSAITWLSAASWAADTPPSVGLTSGDTFSEWFEGEIWLEAGAWTFSLLVDDHGFVEVAAPGTASFTRVLNANWSTAGTGTFTAEAAGWHPFRYAIAEDTAATTAAASPSLSPDRRAHSTSAKPACRGSCRSISRPS